MHRIISILPKGEGFSTRHFGAIALCLRDFTLSSRFKNDTLVLGSGDEGYDTIDYMALPAARWFENRTRSYARQAVSVIRSEQAQLVEIHNRPHLVHLIAPHIKGAKIALHLHNDPQEMKKAHSISERRKLLSVCSGILCVSNYIRNRFLEGLNDSADAKKVQVIYNGIEIPPSLPDKENRMVFAGRMTEGKGAFELAQALSIALPKLPDWRVVFIGSRRHAVYKNLTPYEQQVGNILQPFAQQVEWAGFLSHTETLKHFTRASIAVIPSVWQEPFGRTALEAMAYGCAVISSGRGGLQEVTGDAALTTQPSPKHLAEAIFSLATDPEARKTLRLMSRERAKFFSIANVTRALDDARETILAGSSYDAS